MYIKRIFLSTILETIQEIKNVFKPRASACYLSHIKCWEKIVNGNIPFTLILEDDIQSNKVGTLLTSAFEPMKISQKFHSGNFINQKLQKYKKCLVYKIYVVLFQLLSTDFCYHILNNF